MHEKAIKLDRPSPVQQLHLLGFCSLVTEIERDYLMDTKITHPDSMLAQLYSNASGWDLLKLTQMLPPSLVRRVRAQNTFSRNQSDECVWNNTTSGVLVPFLKHFAWTTYFAPPIYHLLAAMGCTEQGVVL
ncbi:hypothetical protein ACH5RR_012639 [Cinchona calisaya]|uniref:Uncharacterized protein n=1 Tax=Cinchona calisaya TaxID=153742 RepID=A0ABD3A8V3_9GENT